MLAQILAACVYVNSATIARDEKKNLHNLLTALLEKKKVDDKFAKSWNFCEYGFCTSTALADLNINLQKSLIRHKHSVRWQHFFKMKARLFWPAVFFSPGWKRNRLHPGPALSPKS